MKRISKNLHWSFTAKQAVQRTQIFLSVSLLLGLISCGWGAETQPPVALATTTTEVQAPQLPAKNYAQAVLKRELYEDINSDPLNPYAYVFDRTDNYGRRPEYHRQVLYIIRARSFGKPELVSQVLVKDGVVSQEMVVKKPSYTHYKLEAVKAIVATWEDGQTFVFDLDDFQMELAQESRHASWMVKSNNPRSINSDYFWNTLKKAYKVSLVPRDIHWVTNTGKKTKYKLKSRDFFYSYLRSFSLTPKFRHENGGSPELDQQWFQASYAAKFDPKTFYPNEYLAILFGIDTPSLRNFNKDPAFRYPIEVIDVEGKPTEVFSIFINKGAEPDSQIYNYVRHYLVNSQELNPAPSEYIAEKNKKLTSKKYGAGVMKEIGYYWYGEKPEQMLWVSPYIPYSREVIGSSEIVKERKNPHFFDQEWVKNPDNVQHVITKRQNRGEDYQQVLYANFSQGLLSRVNFANLDKAVSDSIHAGTDPVIKEHMIRYSKIPNFDAYPRAQVAVSVPSPAKNSAGEPSPDVYFYNDAYAEFMYGGTREELAKGTVNTTPSFFGDDQIAFRSLLVAGVNWHKAVFDQTDGEFVHSLTLAAVDSELNGSDHDTAKYKTPGDGLAITNTPFVLKDGKRWLEVPHSLNVAAANSINQTEAYMGGGRSLYEKMQEQMTEILDRFYAKKGWSNDVKLVWEWGWDTVEINDRWVAVWTNVIRTINSLDKKGRILLKRRQFDDDSQINTTILGGYSARRRGHWFYDFAGNTSYIDGVWFMREGVFYYSFFPILAQRDEKDPDNPFPLLTRLAKIMKQAIEEGLFRFKIPFEKWASLTNGESYQPFDLFDDENYPNLFAEMTRFYFWALKKFTNEEHLKLNVEVSVLVGPKFSNAAHDVDIRKGTRELFQDGFYKPLPISHEFTRDLFYDPLPNKK